MNTRNLFDMLVDRKNTGSVKWDCIPGVTASADMIPLWVADMDFRVSQPVTDALIKTAGSGIFGYSVLPETLYSSFSGWVRRVHGQSLFEDEMIFSEGMLSSLSVLVNVLTMPGDGIVIQPPVYPPFFELARQGGRKLVENSLVLKNGRYHMDLTDLEKKLLQPETKMMILCNPHNPTGNVWDPQTLTAVARMCAEYGVILLSDEIHRDLIYDNRHHASAAECFDTPGLRAFALFSPAKTFNIPGLPSCITVCSNKRDADIYRKGIRQFHAEHVNPFSIAAAESAFSKGEEWYRALIGYLAQNRKLISEYLSGTGITCMAPEATYLAWLDFRNTGFGNAESLHKLLNEAKVALFDGRMFGRVGEGFHRLNFGCPRAILEAALERIASIFKMV